MNNKSNSQSKKKKEIDSIKGKINKVPVGDNSEI